MAFCFTGYNQAYRDETERKASSRLGKRIYEARWEFINRHCDGGTLLDYGCGTGAFHSCAPVEYDATGWDVNPDSGFHDPITLDSFDILTMWDSMEHMDSPLAPIVRFRPEFVFISTPNAEDTDLSWFESWRHFKPIEHLFYFTPKTLTMSMRSIGYKLLRVEYTEGGLRNPANPRAIFSAAYQCLNS